MNAEARSASLSRWTSGQSRWLCATSAFAQGIDYSHVTYVLHYRVPKHITLYAQQSGRLARRDGITGVSHLIYSDRPTRRDDSDVDLGGFNAVVDLTSKAQCRILAATAFLDSTPSNCYMLGPCQLCDFCAHQQVSRFPYHLRIIISSLPGSPTFHLSPTSPRRCFCC